jgi:hypothetical protein
MHVLTLLEVAKKHISTRPKVHPQVMCSTPITKAATAPLADRLRFFNPWLQMPVASTREALNLSNSI